LKKNYFVIQIEKCQGKQTNINTWSNSRSEVKTNEMSIIHFVFQVAEYLKNEVHKRQINNLNELIEEITNCCRKINEQMLMLQNNF
jgi:hypothetical protein